MSVHLYTAQRQPATRFRVELRDGSHRWSRWAPRSIIMAGCCRRLRWAAYCEVEVYYDAVYAFCRPGRGCRG